MIIFIHKIMAEIRQRALRRSEKVSLSSSVFGREAESLDFPLGVEPHQ